MAKIGYNRELIVVVILCLFWVGICEDSSTHRTTIEDSASEEKKTDEFEEFLTPYGLVSQMDKLFKHFKNANVTKEVIGRTAEYNDIVLFKVTALKPDTYFRAKDNRYVDEVPEKKIIFIVHGLSVLGIRSLSTLTEEHMIKKLIRYYLSHLDRFDIYLIPLANPDGYVAAYKQTIWKKNRSPQSDCPGVMLDRNFDVGWNNSHQQSSCSQNYPGASPFSEAETRAVRDVFHYHGHKIIAYINVHSGTFGPIIFKGEAILYPRGFTDAQTDDDKYIDLRGEVEEAIKNASFTALSVTVDTLHNWYGPVTGTSVDYASSVYGIPFAMEFVMQLYQKPNVYLPGQKTAQYYALTQVWRRLIDVVFNYFWKSLNTGGNDIVKK